MQHNAYVLLMNRLPNFVNVLVGEGGNTIKGGVGVQVADYQEQQVEPDRRRSVSQPCGSTRGGRRWRGCTDRHTHKHAAMRTSSG